MPRPLPLSPLSPPPLHPNPNQSPAHSLTPAQTHWLGSLVSYPLHPCPQTLIAHQPRAHTLTMSPLHLQNAAQSHLQHLSHQSFMDHTISQVFAQTDKIPRVVFTTA